ncbi:MAG: heat-inducible transcription repressor HrcA [Dehalococcoidia bacterium]|nr:heat-inducible transcription repressor HrcA [Dehalococcoidia bacterium]
MPDALQHDQPQPVLSERKQLILKAIVESYIGSATPVGSGQVVREYVTDVSSATVRNEMVGLAEAGLLFQPHTSSGRIPSEGGFRYFVRQLMEERTLTRAEQSSIRRQLFAVQLAREEWLGVAATLMARVARAAGIISAPLAVQCRVKHVELLAIQEGLGLLVLVLQEGTVKQQLVELPVDTSQTDLSAASSRLNQRIHGLTRSELEAQSDPMSDLEAFVASRLASLMGQIDEHLRKEFHHTGLVELLELPEFQQPEQARRVVRLLEHPEELFGLLETLPWSQGMHILIGARGPRMAILQDLGLVVSYYGTEGVAGGFVGVLGPMRLPYSEVVPVVRHVSQVMTELLGDLFSPADT